jgi:muramidase (phage lysozyme)
VPEQPPTASAADSNAAPHFNLFSLLGGSAEVAEMPPVNQEGSPAGTPPQTSDKAADSPAMPVPVAAPTEKQKTRLEENKKYLQNPNVRTFLHTIAETETETEGGGYDFKYGALKGRKNDPWRFTDFSTHLGPCVDGKNTAAGMYQTLKDTWKVRIENMGLTDFSPMTQDLIAVDILRTIHALDAVMSGDLPSALEKASAQWSSLPKGPSQGGHYPDQITKPYEQVVEIFKNNGGHQND